MIIAWDNEADSAVITAVSSEVSTLPGTNVQQQHLSRKWYMLPTINDAYLVFDMGAAVTVGVLGVFGTNLTSAAQYRLTGSANADGITAAVYDSTLTSAGVKNGYGAVYKPQSNPSARYWRLRLVDASLTQLQVGRVFLGPKWQHAQALVYGWGVQVQDLSPVEESHGGQEYPEELPRRRVVDFKLDFLTEAEMFDNAFAMAKANGVVRDVLVIPQENSSYISEQSVWGRVVMMEPIIHRLSQTFATKIQVKERL
jgi:hypothetical protein